MIEAAAQGGQAGEASQMDRLPRAGQPRMALVFGLHNVGEADEAQAAHVVGVYTAIVAAGVGLVCHGSKVRCCQAGGQIVLPAVCHVVGDAGHIDRNGGRLVVCVCDNLDGVRIEVVIGNGLRRGVEDGRDVIFRYDVARNGGRVRDQYGFLDIALEDLAAGWRGQSRRGRETAARGGGHAGNGAVGP